MVVAAAAVVVDDNFVAVAVADFVVLVLVVLVLVLDAERPVLDECNFQGGDAVYHAAVFDSVDSLFTMHHCGGKHCRAYFCHHSCCGAFAALCSSPAPPIISGVTCIMARTANADAASFASSGIVAAPPYRAHFLRE